MRSFLLYVFFVLLVNVIAPNRPDLPKQEKKPAVQVLPVGETNWGLLRQNGKNFTLEDHPVWDGVGQIREDGKIQILWTFRLTGRPAPGVYQLKDGKLVGVWGYGDEVEFDEDGELHGQLHDDIVHRPMVEPEPFN